MKIMTRDFGEVEIGEEDIVEFRSPIYGFESLMRFVLLYEEENHHIVWLQSLEDPETCFVMVDPAVVDPAYRPSLSPEMRRKLGEGSYLFWLICVVAPDFKDSTVNLKSPIVLNVEKNCAVQAILDQSYPIRQPLFAKKEGKPSC